MRVVAIVLGLCLAGVVPAAAQVTAGGNGGGLIASNPGAGDRQRPGEQRDRQVDQCASVGGAG
jgi:hypothetical protein